MLHLSRLCDGFSQALNPSQNSCTQDFENSTSPDSVSTFKFRKENPRKKGHRKTVPWKKNPWIKSPREKGPPKFFELILSEYLIRQAANAFYNYKCLSFEGLPPPHPSLGAVGLKTSIRGLRLLRFQNYIQLGI